LIEYVIDALGGITKPLFIVADSFERYARYAGRATILVDETPGLGPLGGLYTGLKASPDDYNFVAPCDTPFINVNLVSYMLGEAPGSDALIPRTQERLHTVNAVYAKACLPAIEESLDNGLFRISSIFDRVKVSYLDDQTIDRFDADRRSFFNINTQQDMDEATRIINELGGLNAEG
jgi:molybdopterin-guanine dinucleotide biosynthesis protein A